MAGCAIGGWLIAVLAAAPVPAPPPATAPALPPPSMELLLHLAEFGDAEDRYIDPAELEAALPEEPQVQTGEARKAEDDGSQDEEP